jgi:hypothetical protein
MECSWIGMKKGTGWFGPTAQQQKTRLPCTGSGTTHHCQLLDSSDVGFNIACLLAYPVSLYNN